MKCRLESVEYDGRLVPLWRNTPIAKNAHTIIVGKNGTGKSRLLSQICRAFAGMENDGIMPRLRDTRSARRQSDRQSEIKLLCGSESIVLRTEGDRVSFADSSGMLLPRKVVAVTMSPFDKFPTGRRPHSHRDLDLVGNQDRQSLRRYCYVGGKSALGQISLKAQLFRVIDAFISATEDEGKDRGRLKEIFQMLGYEARIGAEFRFRHSKESVEIALGSTKKAAKGRFIAEPLRRLHETSDYHLVEEVRKAYLEVAEGTGARAASFELEIDKAHFGRGSLGLFRQAQLLRRVGLLSIADLRLTKSGSGEIVAFEDASSGEQSVVLTLLCIASELEDSSIVIIDEPEISLHPEWQERFIPLLESTFCGFNGCHFIYATHSPQIVAQAGNCNAQIVTMDDLSIKDAREVANKSADYQLATSFDAPGARNEYLAREALLMLEMIGRRDIDSDEFKSTIGLLTQARIHLQDDDPVARMIDAARQAIGEH